MRTILLCVIVAVGVTTASDQRVQSSDDESSRTKRMLLDPTQAGTIKTGFDAATHLFGLMKAQNFAGVVGEVVSKASSFFGAMGPFVGLVLSLASGPTAEYRLLKSLYTTVENRFDQVDVQLATLFREVSFLTTKAQFTTWESKINAVQLEFKTLSQVSTKAAYSSESREFIRTYDRTYASSGAQLYNSIIDGGTLTGGLFYQFMTYSQYDQKQTQRFMIGSLNLLMKAAALEISYAQLKRNNVATHTKNWVDNIRRVKEKMAAIDKAIKGHYKTQMISDVNTFATQHPKGSLSNTAFADQLYSKLTTKVKLKKEDGCQVEWKFRKDFFHPNLFFRILFKYI